MGLNITNQNIILGIALLLSMCNCQVIAQDKSIIKITEELLINQRIDSLSKRLSQLIIPDSQQIQIFDNDLLSKCLKIDGNSGQVHVKCRIDRETICPMAKSPSCIVDLKFVVLPQSKLESVKVEIVDINDNVPQWPNSNVELTMFEFEGNKFQLQSLIVNKATDLDAGRNAAVKYYLREADGVKDSDSFKIQYRDNSSTGFLKIAPVKVIDREKQSRFNLVLLAVDQGIQQLTGTLQLTIKVNDRNDNDPQFDKSEYSNNALSESTAIGAQVLQVSVKDKDEGNNSLVTFQMFDREALYYFKVDEYGRILVKNKLDYDSGVKEFRFILLAVDNPVNDNQRTGSAQIHIMLKDENDEKPVIITHITQRDPSTGAPAINENESNLPLVLAHLQVTDKDFSGSDRVLCNLKQPNRKIRLVEKSLSEYQIEAVAPFDRERQSSFIVDIECLDQASNAQMKVIKFHVLDQNDNYPIFERIYHFKVYENASNPNMKIGQILAKDADDGDNKKITYRILGEESHYFKIDEVGYVYTKEVLDREKISQYNITVLAEDHGKPPLTGTGSILIEVQDVNDWPPIFSQSLYEFHVPESSDVGRKVGSVEATDLDSKGSEFIRYILHWNNFQTESQINPFEIYPKKGDIYIKYPMVDRERTAVYILTVLATDRISSDSRFPAHTSSATVKIVVTDVNDNAPIFTTPNHTIFTVNIPRNIHAGDFVGQVQATDADEGDNGRVLYRIVSSDAAKLFELNPTNGKISLTESLIKPAQYKLTIQSCDLPTSSTTSDSQQKHLCSRYLMIFIKIQQSLNNEFNPSFNTKEPTENFTFVVIILLVILLLVVMIAVVVFILVKQRVCLGCSNQSPNSNSHNDIHNINNNNFITPSNTLNQSKLPDIHQKQSMLQEPTMIGHRQHQISAEYQSINDNSPSYNNSCHISPKRSSHSPQQVFQFDNQHMQSIGGSMQSHQPASLYYQTGRHPSFHNAQHKQHHIYQQMIPAYNNSTNNRIHSPMSLRHQPMLQEIDDDTMDSKHFDQMSHNHEMATMPHFTAKHDYFPMTVQHNSFVANGRRSNSLLDFPMTNQGRYACGNTDNIPQDNNANIHYDYTHNPISQSPPLLLDGPNNYQSLRKPKPRASFV